jgi:hypothetical protein
VIPVGKYFSIEDVDLNITILDETFSYLLKESYPFQRSFGAKDIIYISLKVNYGVLDIPDMEGVIMLGHANVTRVSPGQHVLFAGPKAEI